MNESISRAAGTQHGQEFPPDAMEALITSIGRMPQQRTTLYGEVPEERRAASFVAADLAPIVLTPPATPAYLRLHEPLLVQTMLPGAKRDRHSFPGRVDTGLGVFPGGREYPRCS